MNLFDDIKSRSLLYAKGLLFLALGSLACAIILHENPSFRTITLLVIAIWAFCRFYYFLFYVLEHYAGRNRKYAGILDALAYLLKKRHGKTEHAGFWAEGYSCFCDTLSEEERERLAPLKAELKQACEPEHKVRLKQEIAAIKAEFRQKRKAAGQSLY